MQTPNIIEKVTKQGIVFAGIYIPKGAIYKEATGLDGSIKICFPAYLYRQERGNLTTPEIPKTWALKYGII